MAEQVSKPTSTSNLPTPAPEDQVISADEYMEKYAHDFYEWADGKVYPMTPVSDLHDELSAYFRDVLRAYFALRPIGKVKEAPFVLRLDTVNVRREPDLMVILKDNTGEFTDTAMIGPADICIEIVSLESVDRDYGRKFVEYEAAGVKEYWTIDPIRKEAVFRQLAGDRYQTQVLENKENYRTSLLPDLVVHVPTLWIMPLPDFFKIGEAVRAMLGG